MSHRWRSVAYSN